MRIILHGGTPKTGTTSRKLFLDANHATLLDRGVLDPRAGVTPPPKPKHQWMISALMSQDASQRAAGQSIPPQQQTVTIRHRTEKASHGAPDRGH
jgi:hypothetical protein